MKLRTVSAIHILPLRVSLGYREYLLHPHRGWQTLALPAKKVPLGPDEPITPTALRPTFDAIWHEEMGLDQAPAWLRILPAVTLRMTSPTAGQITEYRIVPVVAPVDRKEQKAVQGRLGGPWRRRGDLLVQAGVSPTARVALEALLATPEPTQPPPQDANWTARLLWGRQQNDRDFLGRLFAEMTPWLLAQLRRCADTRGLFANEADVEDAINDGLLNVLLHLDDFVETASAGAWVWAITCNTAISVLRRRTRNQAESLNVGAEGDLRPVTADDRDVLDEVEAGEARTWRQRILAEVLAEADPLHRQAWELRYREELQYDEIAERMKGNQNTIAGWIRRLNLRLKSAARRGAAR